MWGLIHKQEVAMSTKSLFTGLMASSLIAVALSSTGCKKEEQSKAPETVASQQAVAPATSAAPALTAILDYGFEDGIGGWTGIDKTVKTEPASDQKHGGANSLKISGTAGEGRWNFANSSRLDLETGKKYKITGWMYVEAWNKENLPPLLKFGVYQDNKWVSNAFTTKYDLKKTKQWQQVGTIFVAPKEGKINGNFSLEKGTKDPVTATVYLDDLKLAPIQ
jgi:hypothetical protein